MMATSGIAEAATSGNHTISYDVSWIFNSSRLHRCIVLRAAGSVSYTFGIQSGQRYYVWSNQKVNAPALTANIYSTYSGGKCSGSVTITKATIEQHWAGTTTCGFNPSVGVGFPWGVSVGGWPGCTTTKDQGYYSTTYATTSSSYHQYNSGSPVTYPNYQNASNTANPCYGIYVSAVFYINSTSDSFGIGNGSSQRSICLSQ
jgi:hypothetical protein